MYLKKNNFFYTEYIEKYLDILLVLRELRETNEKIN